MPPSSSTQEGVDAVGLKHVGLTRREDHAAIAKVHYFAGALDVDVEVQFAAAAQGVYHDGHETSRPGGRLTQGYWQQEAPTLGLVDMMNISTPPTNAAAPGGAC